MTTRPGQISSERNKMQHYLGVACVCAGLLLILSAFVTGATSFGSFDVHTGPTLSEVLRGVGGIIAVGAGAILIKTAART